MAATSVWSWMWKEEPASPLFTSEQDEWSSPSDNVAVEVVVGGDAKPSRAETASKLLEDLDQWVKEEEPFPAWLEEKMDLPIFDDLPPPPVPLTSQDVIAPLKPSPPLVLPTAPSRVKSLDVVSVKPEPHFNTLKIPQKRLTPVETGNIDLISLPPVVPYNLDPVFLKSPQKTNLPVSKIEVVAVKPFQSQTVISLSPQYMVSNAVVVPSQQTPVLIDELDYSLSMHETLTPPESPKETEIEEMQVLTMLQEMQADELDELVRMRVESLVDSPQDSSRSSSVEESESVLSPSSDSGCSDLEWTVAASYEVRTPKKRRVSKPYSRAPPEDRRERKKEQNKNAATRYRLKKKQEVEGILSEERQLQETNEDLKSELTEIQREIKYLKNLLRDMFKAKGFTK